VPVHPDVVGEAGTPMVVNLWGHSAPNRSLPDAGEQRMGSAGDGQDDLRCQVRGDGSAAIGQVSQLVRDSGGQGQPGYRC